MVLVGTIVKPVADLEKVSHEELSWIVDFTASPIASVLAFNAWPVYVQALPLFPGSLFSRPRPTYLLLFQKRSFEFLRNPRGPRHTLAQPRYHPFLRPRDSRGARTSQDHRSTRRARSAANECERAAGEPCSQRIQNKRPRILFSLFLLLGTAIGTFILWGVRK